MILAISYSGASMPIIMFVQEILQPFNNHVVIWSKHCVFGQPLFKGNGYIGLVFHF